MGQRQATVVEKSLNDKTWDDFIQCETDYDAHEVHPTSWPPPRLGTLTGDPSISARCVRCNTNLVVYAGHATGALKGIHVVLPEPEKRGPGRPRKDESA